MRMRTMLVAIAAVALLLVSARQSTAIPLTFSFSFTDPTGFTPGTVTGRILGLADNCTNCAATSVFLDTFPSAYTQTGVVPPTPSYDAALWDGVNANEFTVFNGSITHASFGAFDTVINSNGIPLFWNFGLSDTQQVLQIFAQAAGHVVGVAQTQLLSAPATFATVPEPSALGLLGAGLIALTLRRRVRRR